MINDFLKRLKSDFTNIDEVYNELLANYNPDNINTTELTFIKSIQFVNIEPLENVPKLSMYLGKKCANSKWHNIDYYNRYIETKQFYNKPIQAFKTNEYDKVVINLKEYKSRYNYIFEKLENNSKIELKYNCCDQLEKLKNKQSETIFKAIIENLIIEINNDYLLYNQKTETTGITAITSTVEKPKPKDYKNIISDFNLNEFNEITFNLFNYLIVNYNKKGKVKYLNIFRYLKEINKDSYAFNFTQKTYKEYIYEKYEVELTTFNTANFEFDDKEKPILSGFEQAFRNIKP